MQRMPRRTWLAQTPSLASIVSRYAVADGRLAPYVVVGVVQASGLGTVGGVLAFASNEIHAHILKRAFAPHAASDYGVGVLRGSGHPDGATFDLNQWRARVGALPVEWREGPDIARLA